MCFIAVIFEFSCWSHDSQLREREDKIILLFCVNVQLLPHYKAIVAIYFNFKLSQKDKSTNTIYTSDMKDFARFDNNNHDKVSDD